MYIIILNSNITTSRLPTTLGNMDNDLRFIPEWEIKEFSNFEKKRENPGISTL